MVLLVRNFRLWGRSRHSNLRTATEKPSNSNEDTGTNSGCAFREARVVVPIRTNGDRPELALAWDFRISTRPSEAAAISFSVLSRAWVSRVHLAINAAPARSQSCGNPGARQPEPGNLIHCLLCLTFMSFLPFTSASILCNGCATHGNGMLNCYESEVLLSETIPVIGGQKVVRTKF